jgi:hypothetical protein
MAEVDQTKFVKAGGWRTLESGWNTSFACRFFRPSGAQIKIRYGAGWWFGSDSQKQTLDGLTTKVLNVGSGASKFYARVQIKVQNDIDVSYTYIPTGP